jgi:hypothetical protein
MNEFEAETQAPGSGAAAPAGVSALRADQFARWGRGERLRVEEYLTRHPALAADAEVVLDLLYGELLLREHTGEAPHLDGDLERFSQLAEQLRRQFAVHQALACDTRSGEGPATPASPPLPDPCRQDTVMPESLAPAAPLCVAVPATRSSANSVGAAWASSTRRGRQSSAGWSPSRWCCTPSTPAGRSWRDSARNRGQGGNVPCESGAIARCATCSAP